MTSWPAGRLRMPRIARRVVCGLSLVMATFSPTSAFVSVDFPTLGRPTNVTKPQWIAPSPVPSDVDMAQSPFFGGCAGTRSTNTVAMPRPRPRDAPPVRSRPS